MLQAMIRGKLSHRIEGMEDVLTSCVFGLIRHLPERDVLIPYLRLAIDSRGNHPFEGLSDDAIVVDGGWEFWPELSAKSHRGSQPDLMLRMSDCGCKSVIGVEAKFLHSRIGQGGYDILGHPYHQLKAELELLSALAERERHARPPILLYVTADFVVPTFEFPDDQPIRDSICWLSWRHLELVLNPNRSWIEQELKELVEHHDLFMFNEDWSIRTISTDWEFE